MITRVLAGEKGAEQYAGEHRDHMAHGGDVESRDPLEQERCQDEAAAQRHGTLPESASVAHDGHQRGDGDVRRADIDGVPDGLRCRAH
jgi:hypothetical protein